MVRPLNLAVLVLLLVGVACQAAAPAVAPEAAATPLPAGWYRRTLGGGGGQTGIAIDPTDTDRVYATTDNGGLVKSTDGGDTWLPSNNNLGNPLLGDIALDPLNPQVLYVTAEVYSRRRSYSDEPVTGELYRSRDGGQSWEVVFAEGMGAGDGRAFGIIQWPSTRNILLPHDPAQPGRYDQDADGLTDVIYVGGWDWDADVPDRRGGLWKSEDEGVNFTQLALPEQNIWVLRHAPADPETLYAGTYGGGLFVSRDGGHTWESWRSRLPNPMISDLALTPDGQTLYVATNVFYSVYTDEAHRPWRGLYRSTDGGATFSQINTGLDKTSLNFEVIVLDARDPAGQTLYTGPWGPGDQAVYTSTDGGAHWVRMRHETAADPHWFEDFAYLWALEQAPDGTLYAATWRGLYRYDPAEELWRLKVQGLGNVAVESVTFEPGSADVIYLGILDSTPWKSLDAGATWFHIGDGFTTADGQRTANASEFALSPAAPAVVYATGVGPSGRFVSAVSRSDDGGQSWRSIVTGLPPTTSADPVWQANSIVVSPADPLTAYIALEFKDGGGQIYKTTDGGGRWDMLTTVSGRPRDLALSAGDPATVVCVTSNGEVHIGREAGRRWETATIEPGLLLYSVDVFPQDPDWILVGANLTGAYLSTDGGRSWRVVFDQPAARPLAAGLALSDFARARYRPRVKAVRFDPDNRNILYLGVHAQPWMGLGLLRSEDAGQHWDVMGDGRFQMRSVNSFDLQPLSKNLVVGTMEVYYYASGQP